MAESAPLMTISASPPSRRSVVPPITEHTAREQWLLAQFELDRYIATAEPYEDEGPLRLTDRGSRVLDAILALPGTRILARAEAAAA